VEFSSFAKLQDVFYFTSCGFGSRSKAEIIDQLTLAIDDPRRPFDSPLNSLAPKGHEHISLRHRPGCRDPAAVRPSDPP
jgi:hypothetical protein